MVLVWFHATMQGFLTIILLILVSSSSIWCMANAQTYNVVDYGAVGNGKTDDTQAFGKAWAAACGSTGNFPTLLVTGGRTFLLKPIAFTGKCKSASGIHVQVSGNIVAYSDPSFMQGADQWLLFEGVDGLQIDGNGMIDGQGFAWWARQTLNRPTALSFQSCNQLTVSGIKMANSPRNHIVVNACNNVLIYNISVNSAYDSPNTDGINIGDSNGVLVRDSSISCGDDCISVLSGSSNVNITNVNCGPGHGISIGSLGMNMATSQVSDVHVSYCTFTQTQNGARIKTFQGGSGYARGITFQHLQLDRVDNPIVIDQYYFSRQNSSQAVAISDVEFNDVRGTGTLEVVVKLVCSDSVPCSNIRLRGINLRTTLPGRTAQALCWKVQGSETANSMPPVPCLSKNAS